MSTFTPLQCFGFHFNLLDVKLHTSLYPFCFYNVRSYFALEIFNLFAHCVCCTCTVEVKMGNKRMDFRGGLHFHHPGKVYWMRKKSALPPLFFEIVNKFFFVTRFYVFGRLQPILQIMFLNTYFNLRKKCRSKTIGLSKDALKVRQKMIPNLVK